MLAVAVVAVLLAALTWLLRPRVRPTPAAVTWDVITGEPYGLSRDGTVERWERLDAREWPKPEKGNPQQEARPCSPAFSSGT
jgi:hypothetical protein